MPDSYTAADLAEALKTEAAKAASGKAPILLFRAREASEELSGRLMDAGFSVVDMAAYMTVLDTRKEELLQNSLKDMDIVVFASASAVRAFCRMTEGMDKKTFPKTVCIGPVTAAQAAKMGLEVAKVAGEYTTEGLINSLVEVAENGIDKTAETAEKK